MSYHYTVMPLYPRVELRSDEVLKDVALWRSEGLGYRRIADKILEKYDIKVSHATVKKLIEVESQRNAAMITTNRALKSKVEQRLEVSLDRIGEASDIVWEGVQKFKSPDSLKEVVALTSLIRSMKEIIEVNIKYLVGDGERRDPAATQFNNIDMAARIRTYMDAECDKCKFKKLYKEKIVEADFS